MSNKKLHLILGLVLAMFVGMVGSFASAITFSINFDGAGGLPVRAGYMRRNITPIHFKDNGNNFGGFIYFSNGVATDEELEISGDYYVLRLGDKEYECRQKVKGFYYNAERGERLWSLDESYNMAGVGVNGGLYTRCNRIGFRNAMEKCGEKSNEAARESCEEQARNDYVDSHGYYGMVRHTYGEHTFVLAAGTNYIRNGNQRIMGDDFAATLIRFDNKYPVGFIYDGNGGVGFLGGKIEIDDRNVEDVFNAYENAGKDLENLFKPSDEGDGVDPTNGLEWLDTSRGGSATNSLLSVIVDGLVGINRDTKNSGIQGNQSNDKMQYFSSVNINNMQLINYAKQKAEILCRGKWKNTIDESSKIQCLDGVPVGSVIEARTGWTYIVKNHDVQVKDMSNFDGAGNYDIFIYNGNLVIDEVTASDDLKVFKKNGFISDKDLETFSGVVKPILEDPYGLYTGNEVVAGKFIKGNFVIDGGIRAKTNSGFDHVYFVYGKMTTKDTVDELGKVFKRRCKMGVEGTDGTPCPAAEKDVDNNILWTNPYENASLVIIDQNYPSPLYE